MVNKKKTETYQHIDGERHDDDGYEQIGQRQRHYEVVRDGLQSPFAAHGQYHEHVAEQGQDREEHQDQAPVVVVVWKK